MNEQEAKAVLSQVKALLGRNYKSAIRQAWFDGDYAGQLLSDFSGPLQRIRNTFGPSWLVRAQPDDMKLTHGSELAEMNEMDAKHPGWNRGR